MTTKTLYVDSRTRIRGSHADFSISLPEAMTLRGARLYVDAIRTTDTFPTVSSRNRYVYFLNGTGGVSAISLASGAYTGATFAAELSAKSGRSCTYYPGSNSIQLGYAEGTRIVWKDEELSGFLASAFPFGATPHDPQSINDILGGDASVAENSITFPFVTMAPLQDLYLTSHQLMVHDHAARAAVRARQAVTPRGLRDHSARRLARRLLVRPGRAPHLEGGGLPAEGLQRSDRAAARAHQLLEC